MECASKIPQFLEFKTVKLLCLEILVNNVHKVILHLNLCVLIAPIMIYMHVKLLMYCIVSNIGGIYVRNVNKDMMLVFMVADTMIHIVRILIWIFLAHNVLIVKMDTTLMHREPVLNVLMDLQVSTSLFSALIVIHLLQTHQICVICST